MLGNCPSLIYFKSMERVARTLELHDERIPPLIEDRNLAMETFWEILRRGRSLYPDDGTGQRYPRVYRIVPLKGS
jgi:hypothetical protein